MAFCMHVCVLCYAEHWYCVMGKEEFGLGELVGPRCSVAPALARLLSGSKLCYDPCSNNNFFPCILQASQFLNAAELHRRYVLLLEWWDLGVSSCSLYSCTTARAGHGGILYVRHQHLVLRARKHGKAAYSASTCNGGMSLTSTRVVCYSSQRFLSQAAAQYQPQSFGLA